MSMQKGNSRAVWTLWVVGGVILLCSSAGAGVGLPGREPTEVVVPQDSLRAGDDAPAFVMDDLASGEPVFLSDFAGRTLRQPWKNSPRQVVVLCFWASWSAPCQQEIADLSALAAKLGGKPVKFFLVNTGERAGATAESIRAIVSERGYRLPVLLDATGTVADRYGVRTLPTTVVASKYGFLKLLHDGPESTVRAKLEDLLTKLAEEP